MEYFFILGKNETLSLAELNSVWEEQNLEYAGNHVAVLKTEQEIDAESVMQRLGGTVKIGRVEEKFERNVGERIKEYLADLVLVKRKKASGKFKFGVSQYGDTNLNAKNLGMEIKTYLKEQGYNSRLVTSKEKNLSSVVVKTNQLTEKGMELVLFEVNGQVALGYTLEVQPFKDLSYRDYNRPARDDRSGMIPPKLAQIMINLTGVSPDQNSYLLDPFCGSGTMITEAALMGWKNLMGIDASEKAIEDASQNMEWVLEKHKTPQPNWNFDTSDAKQISDKLKPHSVDAIVTEPYLGPQRGKIDTDRVVPELEELYSSALQDWQKVLKQGGRIVMIWPLFTSHQKKLNPDISGLEIVPPIAVNKKEARGLTSRNTLIYGREGQKIWREILILRKK